MQVTVGNRGSADKNFALVSKLIIGFPAQFHQNCLYNVHQHGAGANLNDAFTRISNLNALFTLSCEKFMKSHANNIKLNELFSLLNVDLGGHSNSLEIE